MRFRLPSLRSCCLAALLPLFAVVVAPPPADAADAASIGASLAKLTAGPAAGKVQPPAPGHLKLADAPDARLVTAADGRRIGWMFGESHFDYDPSGPGEAAIRVNFDRAGIAAAGKAGSPIRLAAQRALWITPAAEAAKSVAEGAPSELDAPSARLLERFSRTRLIRGAELEPSILIAEALLASRPTATAAILDTGKGFVFYLLDPETQEEILTWAYEKRPAPNGLDGWLTTYRLDRRPIARARKAIPQPAIELRSLDVSLTESAGEMGRIVAREEISARRPTPFLRLTLDETDFSFESGAVRVVARPTEIREVAGSDGKPLPFLRAGNGLLISLPAPLAANHGLPIRVTYDYSLRRPWGDQYWRLADQAWYPRPGGFRDNWPTFHATVSAKKPAFILGSGRVVSRSSGDGNELAEFEEKRPIVFPSLLAGRFFPYEVDAPGGGKLIAASYGLEREGGAKRLGAIVAGFLEVGEKLLGPQPTKELSIIELRGWGWGESPWRMIELTQEAFNPVMGLAGPGSTPGGEGERSTDRRGSASMQPTDPEGELAQILAGTEQTTGTYVGFLKGGVNERIAHEVAHAWWGHITRLPAEQDQWLEESMAEYTAGVLLASTKSKGELDKLAGYWKARGSEVADGIAIADANLLHWDQQKNYRFNLLYCRGPWALHALRQEIGDQAFFTILRSFLRSFDAKPAGTEEFLGLVNFVTKKDYRPWFEKYIYGAEIPKG